MDRRQRRAPRLLGSFYGPVHRVRWCKLINCTDPLWLHPSGLAEVFVVFMKSFSDFLSWSPHWVPRWSFFFLFFPYIAEISLITCVYCLKETLSSHMFFSPLYLCCLLRCFCSLDMNWSYLQQLMIREYSRKKKASCFSFILTSKLWNKVVWATSD